MGEYTIRNWMIISLTHLNISDNALERLSDDSFIAQSGLEVIDLSGNELEDISEKTFMYIPKLRWLSLANNKKLKIPDGVPFLNNDNLQVLHLEDCGLYRISLSSFKGLSNLRELYLSYNKITTVGIGAGTLGRHVLKIRYLELSHNNLQKVPRDLTKLQSLEALGMRHNELRNLSDILLVERQVKRLNISDNKWECLCEDCDIGRICDSSSCQIDMCESPSQRDSVHCSTEDLTTIVNKPLREYAVAVTESHALQQDATTTRPQYLLAIACLLGAVCAVLSSVNVYLHLRERNGRSHNMDPEQSVPLTVVT
jgi:hypothetical protein